MGDWLWTRAAYPGGNFQIVISNPGRGGRTADVTYLRGAPTLIDSLADADPFGDSTAQFTLPSITAFDDLNAPDLSGWLAYYSNVDVYWVPSVPAGDGRYDPYYPPVIDPLTNQTDVLTPAFILNADHSHASTNRIRIWEGFIASMDFSVDGGNAALQISCQGALFQVDRYLQKPFFPAQPWPLEMLVADAFDSIPNQPKHKPHLRTRPLQTRFPAGWRLRVPTYTGNTAYTPAGKPGSLWSGYSSRQTGSWDHALTSFVQNQLTVMITDGRSGVKSGNQWTVQHEHASASGPGRQPVLTVRDRNARADFSLQLGLPGIEVRLTGDSTQSENVIYGDGTGVDGTVWRNAVVANDGSRTDYLPLAASRDVYPASGNLQFVKGAFASEAYTQFGTGFDQPAATIVANQQLARDRDPGWTGTITLSTDPSPTLSRWLIRAGMTLTLLGFAGSGSRGIRFHVASTTKSPEQGTIELTVDTRYRDLLTVEEAQARTRDPLTPVKMLQVNRTSVTIEDIQAPWDYRAGSGFLPKDSTHFHAYRPKSQPFPYVDWARRHPPLHYPHWYVKVKANAGYDKRTQRWGGTGVARWSRAAILTSEKDTVNRTEVYAVDVYGRPLKVPFHISFYYHRVTTTSMPHLLGQYSPYLNNAFEKTNPATGQDNNPSLWGDDSLIIGWGNRSAGTYNRAGFSPGRESDGGSPTGQLLDDSAWSFDNTGNPEYDRLAKPGQRQKAFAVTIYAMIYCEWTEPVYFQGRLFRQNPGIS